MDEKTQAEYDRIKAGPQKGAFTFLHHEGPVVEESSNIMERIEYILTDKPQDEHYTRLRHIVSIPAPADKAYQEAIAPADKAILALIPNCGWDGKTIFGKDA
mgnify:CR=1 FL=1